MYIDCGGLPIQFTGGTSEAAPLTAGVAALVIQAYREGHAGVTPTPAQVKQLIVSNTDDIGSPADQQGSGRLDAYKAVLAAMQTGNGRGGAGQGGHHGRGSGGGGAQTPVISDAQTQLHVTDQPATAETLQDTITNSGNRRENLSLNTRALGAYSTVDSQTVTLANGDPQLEDEGGNENNLHQPDGVYYLGSGKSPGYGVVNIGARYRISPHYELFAQVNNALNRHYFTAGQLASTPYDNSGNFLARPFAGIRFQGDTAYPVRNTTFLSPGAPVTVFGGVKVNFGRAR